MPAVRLSLAILALAASNTACSPGEDVTAPTAEAPGTAGAPPRYDAKAFFTTTSFARIGLRLVAGQQGIAGPFG